MDKSPDICTDKFELNSQNFIKSQTQKSHLIQVAFSLNERLEMTYSHMGRPHTTIGAIAFHF
ncbi:conserved protein of unknown function [Shewanella benthica]|uniref:Uncharacterized protein n=1 Tax=Shewanella benthica TaxID=43661 RepID=A0A330LZU2_9GAMM|nr:conserved protein of unknown function [Shewanella benthica]SQH74635.1 conserved protein of unknown function [Shewanella benthica]